MRKIIITLLIFLLLINILYVWGGVIYYPLQSMDSIGIWLFKAKAFYIEGGFPNSFLHNSIYLYSHQHYPLGLPFVIYLLYQIIGGINEKLILLFYPFTYMVILFLVYKIIRMRTSVTLALLFTYIYSMFSPLIAGGGRILAGNADIFIVLIEWIIIFVLYKKKNLYRNYVLITFLIMLASQIKLEGVFLSVILLLLPLKRSSRFILFGISLIPFAAWMITIKTLQIPSDTYIMLPGPDLFIHRLWIIMLGIIKELLNINNWYIFWPLLTVLLFIKYKLSKKLNTILLPAYLIIMAMFISIYLFASNNDEYITSSFDRILFQHSAIIFLIFFEKMNAALLESKNLLARLKKY